MAKSGPIVIVEDDLDDQEIVSDVLKDLDVPNEVVYFERCSDAFTFLKSTTIQPFIILCDINLPQQNGLDFKKQIDADKELRHKSVPFIFYSTAAAPAVVTNAFTEMTVQGFFQKSSNIHELRHAMFIITQYWKLCKHPYAEL